MIFGGEYLVGYDKTNNPTTGIFEIILDDSELTEIYSYELEIKNPDLSGNN